jgi:tRNA(Ile)-lysidine synthase
VAEQIASPAQHIVTVATAHHQDDQAETLLLHLLQGSGLSGLAGMGWVGELPDAQQPPIRLVRPFLALDRATIHDYLRSYGLTWREDSSNHDLAHLRNQVRHQVLPLLATINPNIHATLARTADLLTAEADHADSRDRAALIALTLAHTHQTRILLDLFQLKQYDLATQRGVLRQALLTLGVDLRTTGMAGIDALLDQAHAANPSGPHPLIADWAWTVLRDELSTRALALHRAETLPVEVTHPHLGAPLAKPLSLPSEGTLTCGAWQLHSMLLAPSDLPADWRSRGQPWRLFCDAEACGNLHLTTPQAAMSIAPLGMGGHQRTVGDIFTDRKVPPYLRPGWPVVVNDAGTTVWLCGLVMAESVRVQPTTHQVRQLLWQHQE